MAIRIQTSPCSWSVSVPALLFHAKPGNVHSRDRNQICASWSWSTLSIQPDFSLSSFLASESWDQGSPPCLEMHLRHRDPWLWHRQASPETDFVRWKTEFLFFCSLLLGLSDHTLVNSEVEGCCFSLTLTMAMLQNHTKNNGERAWRVSDSQVRRHGFSPCSGLWDCISMISSYTLCRQELCRGWSFWPLNWVLRPLHQLRVCATGHVWVTVTPCNITLLAMQLPEGSSLCGLGWLGLISLCSSTQRRKG